MELKNPSYLKLSVFFIVGFGLGLSSAFFGLNLNEKSGETVSEDVISLLESQTGQNYELINYDSQNGLYQVDLAGPDGVLETYHVTKDGELFSPSMTRMEDLNNVLEQVDSFSECLMQEEVLLYGSMQDEATMLQIEVLGGQQTVQNIYREVSDEETLEEAQDRGVETIPSIYSNGEILEGPASLGEVEQFTGCQLNL